MSFRSIKNGALKQSGTILSDPIFQVSDVENLFAFGTDGRIWQLDQSVSNPTYINNGLNDYNYFCSAYSSVSGNIVVGGFQSISMSSDGGNTWTKTDIDAGGNEVWTSIAYGNGIFVAIGYVYNVKLTLAYSLDEGETWTYSSALQTNATFGFTVFYDENSQKFIIVSDSSSFYTSSNGVNWVAEGSNPNSTWGQIVKGNVGQDDVYFYVSEQSSKIYLDSTPIFDAQSLNVSLPITTSLNNRTEIAAFLNDMLVISDGTAVYVGKISGIDFNNSYASMSFTTVSSVLPSSIISIVTLSDRFVIADGGGNIAYSFNGFDWIKSSPIIGPDGYNPGSSARYQAYFGRGSLLPYPGQTASFTAARILP